MDLAHLSLVFQSNLFVFLVLLFQLLDGRLNRIVHQFVLHQLFTCELVVNGLRWCLRLRR